MNLYKLTQSVNNDYDTYDSAVVAAKTEEDAKFIHPSGRRFITKDDYFGDWVKKVEDIKAELIGKAVKGTEAGVIVASFNAG